MQNNHSAAESMYVRSTVRENLDLKGDGGLQRSKCIIYSPLKRCPLESHVSIRMRSHPRIMQERENLSENHPMMLAVLRERNHTERPGGCPGTRYRCCSPGERALVTVPTVCSSDIWFTCSRQHLAGLISCRLYTELVNNIIKIKKVKSKSFLLNFLNQFQTTE